MLLDAIEKHRGIAGFISFAHVSFRLVVFSTTRYCGFGKVMRSRRCNDNRGKGVGGLGSRIESYDFNITVLTTNTILDTKVSRMFLCNLV